MSSKVHHQRSLLSSFLPHMRHDYIMRHRRIRAISNIVLITILSLLLAGMILYTSNPGGFSPLGH